MSKKEIVNSNDVHIAHGSHLKNIGFNMSSMRSLALLPENSWKEIDKAILRVAKQELVGVMDLLNYGLGKTVNHLDASAFTVQRTSKLGEAVTHTNPDVASEAGLQDMTTVTAPVVYTFKNYILDVKRVREAAKGYWSIDTEAAEEATYSISLALENILFNGAGTEKYNGFQLHGYLTYPDVNAYTMTGAAGEKSWTHANKTPAQIFDDVNNMINASMSDNHLGPWILYIPWEYQIVLNRDYLTGSTADYPVSGSIKERIMQLDNLDAIRVSRALPNDNIVLVEMSSRTVRWYTGLPFSNVLWEAPGHPRPEKLFKVWTCQVPMILSDYDGQCGIVHGTTT